MEKNEKPIIKHLPDFLDWLEIEKGLMNKSQENYARFLKKFFDWLMANNLKELKPHELTPEHIWKYRVFLSRQSVRKSKTPGLKELAGLKKTTQNYYLIAFRSLLNYFAERDILSLPAEKIKLARDKNEREVRFLSLEQVEKLFSSPDAAKPSGLRDRAILEILFSTGMRISELVALNRDQFKLKSGAKDLELSITGKGGRIRVVYLSERAIDWLKKYLETRNDKEEPLFINYRLKTGAPRRLTPRSIEKNIKRYAVKAGLPLTTTPHVMRHSFSTDLLTKGVDLRTLQEFLGHKSIAATQIYTHVTNKRLREIHRKFHGGRNLKA